MAELLLWTTANILVDRNRTLLPIQLVTRKTRLLLPSELDISVTVLVNRNLSQSATALEIEVPVMWLQSDYGGYMH